MEIPFWRKWARPDIRTISGFITSLRRRAFVSSTCLYLDIFLENEKKDDISSTFSLTFINYYQLKLSQQLLFYFIFPFLEIIQDYSLKMGFPAYYHYIYIMLSINPRQNCLESQVTLILKKNSQHFISINFWGVIR